MDIVQLFGVSHLNNFIIVFFYPLDMQYVSHI